MALSTIFETLRNAGKERKSSFLKKRSKKLLHLARAGTESATAKQRFFGSFFSKKNFFLP
jgi:hypothetical protein